MARPLSEELFAASLTNVQFLNAFYLLGAGTGAEFFFGAAPAPRDQKQPAPTPQPWLILNVIRIYLCISFQALCILFQIYDICNSQVHLGDCTSKSVYNYLSN